MARYRDFDVDLVDCGPLGFKYQYTHVDYDGDEDDRAGSGFATEREAQDAVDEWHHDRLIDDLATLRAYVRQIDDRIIAILERGRVSTDAAQMIMGNARGIIEKAAGMRKDS